MLKYSERSGIIVNGTVDFGRKVTCTVSRTGDLIWKSYLQVDLPAMTQSSGTVAWTRNIGHVLINNISVEIGGQQIDKHYGSWLHLWSELTLCAEHEDGYNVMIGNTAALTTQAASIAASTLYIPLQFWFNRNPGLNLAGPKSTMPQTFGRCLLENSFELPKQHLCC